MRKLSLFLLLWTAVLAGSVALLPGPAGAAGEASGKAKAERLLRDAPEIFVAHVETQNYGALRTDTLELVSDMQKAVFCYRNVELNTSIGRLRFFQRWGDCEALSDLENSSKASSKSRLYANLITGVPFSSLKKITIYSATGTLLVRSLPASRYDISVGDSYNNYHGQLKKYNVRPNQRLGPVNLMAKLVRPQFTPKPIWTDSGPVPRELSPDKGGRPGDIPARVPLEIRHAAYTTEPDSTAVALAQVGKGSFPYTYMELVTNVGLAARVLSDDGICRKGQEDSDAQAEEEDREEPFWTYERLVPEKYGATYYFLGLTEDVTNLMFNNSEYSEYVKGIEPAADKIIVHKLVGFCDGKKVDLTPDLVQSAFLPVPIVTRTGPLPKGKERLFRFSGF